MTYGTGPQAVADHIQNNWQATRTGRPDVPAIVTNEQTDFGVRVETNREDIANNRAVHDLIHCYHPQASGLSIQDRGYDEKNTVEEVQIDVECADRTDPDTGERLYARDCLVGDRDDAGFQYNDGGPYPGVFGEVVYVLEAVRRDFEEWDVARMDVINTYFGNSNANMSLSVELEHIAANTRV